MTFVSPRCWTIVVKKGVFLATKAWRHRYSQAVQHAALRDGGDEIIPYNRSGMEPFPLLGRKASPPVEGRSVAYEGPHGEIFHDLRDVFEYVITSEPHTRGAQLHLSVLQKFLNGCCSESEVRAKDGDCVGVTTSTLEDWLHRGCHPIVKPMVCNCIACGYTASRSQHVRRLTNRSAALST